MVTTNKTLLVTTDSDKKKKCSARQIKQADLAREYQRKLGYASPGQLIKMIGQGKLNNGKISAQDVVRALDIYGPDLGSLKGKTISHRPQLEEEPEIINQQFRIADNVSRFDVCEWRAIYDICYEPIRICTCD
jgi:hypothetical protein